MAAKKKIQKKKKQKQEKAKRQELVRLPEDKALEVIEGLIVRGKPRDAIQTLQQLPYADTPAFLLLKARAYALRARQLREKGLEQEADGVIDILRAHLSRIPTATCEDVAKLIIVAPLSFGIGYYVRHEKQHPACAAVEWALADQIVLSNGWGSLEELPEESIFRADGLIMAEAVPYLIKGQWQQGVSKLEALSRRSPFAPWKLFARAMASAYKNDEEGLRRALKQLPNDFPLKETVRILENKGTAGLSEVHEVVTRRDVEMARDLTKAIQAGERNLPLVIAEFAYRIAPEYTDLAIRSLCEMAALSMARRKHGPEEIQKVLPAHVARPLLLRMEMFFGVGYEMGSHPFCLASRYLKSVVLEFPHVESKERVEAAVYSSLLARAVSNRVFPKMLHRQDQACLKAALDNGSDVKPEDLFVALLDKITSLTPDVNGYYKIIQAMEPGSLSAEGKELFERILLRMREHFSEDPFSYLQLARLYWGKGAYRKSQKVLEEAFKQAPYDTHVREYYGLGLLRASIRGRKRSSGLARKDLEEARNLNIKSLLPLVHAIDATIDYLEQGEQSRSLDSLLGQPDPVLKFRSLIHFYQDLSGLGERKAKSFATEVSKSLHKELKGALKQLGDAELTKIIAPMPQEHVEMMGPFDPLDFFHAHWPKLIEKFGDQQVLGVYVQLLSDKRERHLKVVKKDLKIRLSRQKDNVYFRFLNVLVDYMLDTDEGANGFHELIDDLEPEEEQKLREFCRKIAPNFEDPLSHALSFFDFEGLDIDDFWFGPDFEDDDDEWDDDEMFGGGLNAVDALLSEMNMLGDNKHILQLIFDMMVMEATKERLDDEGIRDMGRMMALKSRSLMDALRKLYSGKGAKSLSRVGKLLLFPDER